MKQGFFLKRYCQQINIYDIAEMEEG